MQLPKTSCICDALRDLVPFIKFKKREKHTWRSVTFSAKSMQSISYMSYTLTRLYNFTHQLKLKNKCISSTGLDSILVAKIKSITHRLKVPYEESICSVSEKSID